MDFKLRSLGYALGAEIVGLDLRKPLGSDTVSALRQANLEHLVLCFRGQELSPAQMDAFCSAFGPLKQAEPAVPAADPQVPSVQILANLPVPGKPEQYIVVDFWHTDLDYTNHPHTLAFLYASQLPDVGGNTMFANMYMAYEALSAKMKEVLEPLEAVHSSTVPGAFGGTSAESLERIRSAHVSAAVHPIVRAHPATGRKALYIGMRTSKIVGMTDEESRPIIDYLNHHATRYEFIYRHSWSPGDLLIWDNGALLHYAVKDYDQNQMRLMHRASTNPPESGVAYDESKELALAP